MESLDNPVWRRRARCLATLLEKPATLAALHNVAHQAWGWAPFLVTNTVAAAEGRELRARLVRGIWLFGRVPGEYNAEEGRALKCNASTQGERKRASSYEKRSCKGCGRTFTPFKISQGYCGKKCEHVCRSV